MCPTLFLSSQPFATVCYRPQPSESDLYGPAVGGRALESDFSWRQDVLVYVGSTL